MTKGGPDPTPPRASVSGISGKFAVGVLDQLLNFRLRQIRNRLTVCYRDETFKLGLAAGAFTVLALVDANPGIAQIDLARFGGFDPTALVGIIDDLEHRGWAKRSRDPTDRRRYQLDATDQGRAALEEMLARAIENEKPARDALSDEELLQFRNGLEKIYQRLL